MVLLQTPALIIAVLFFLNAYILWKNRDGLGQNGTMLVTGKVLPRILIGSVYIYFYLSEINIVNDIPLYQKIISMRYLLVYLGFTEALIYWIKLRRENKK